MLQMRWHERHALSSIFVLVAVAIFLHSTFELERKRVRVRVQVSFVDRLRERTKQMNFSATSLEYFV
jgi:hypothetical protein